MDRGLRDLEKKLAEVGQLESKLQPLYESSRTIAAQQKVAKRQMVVGALPILISAVATVLLVAWPGSLGLDGDQLGRIASLCASLLTAAAVETGVVVAVGWATRQRITTQQNEVDSDGYSVELEPEPDEELEEQYEKAEERWQDRIFETVMLENEIEEGQAAIHLTRQRTGTLLLVETLAVCVAIVTGAIAEPNAWAQAACVFGLFTVVVLLFVPPATLALARNGTDGPSSLDPHSS